MGGGGGGGGWVDCLHSCGRALKCLFEFCGGEPCAVGQARNDSS